MRPPAFSWRPRHKIHEIENLGIRDRPRHLRHRGVIPGPRIALVFAQGLDEVVLALGSEPGDVITSREIRVMTKATVVALGESPPRSIRAASGLS
jgi:hypothetical protein